MRLLYHISHHLQYKMHEEGKASLTLVYCTQYNNKPNLCLQFTVHNKPHSQTRYHAGIGSGNGHVSIITHCSFSLSPLQ